MCYYGKGFFIVNGKGSCSCMYYCCVNKNSVVDVIYVFLCTPLSEKNSHATSILIIKIAFSSHAYQYPSVWIHSSTLLFACSFALSRINVVCPAEKKLVKENGLSSSPLRVTIAFAISLDRLILKKGQNNRQPDSTGNKGLFTVVAAVG